MKKVFTFFFLATILFFLSGCRKLIDKYFPGEQGGHTSNCRISEIVSGEVVYKVKYNASGKLDSIVSDLNFVENDVHLIYLTYDSAGRLSALRRIKGEPDGINVFHRYGYTGNRITTDTIYNTSNATYRVWLANITYDSSDRVIYETMEILYSDIEGEAPFIETQYWYDADGNLIPPSGLPPVTYSDHRNPLRTDRTLQFLARDYSNNAPIGGTAFNENDMPTAFSQPYPFVFNPATGVRQSIIEATGIKYSCD